MEQDCGHSLVLGLGNNTALCHDCGKTVRPVVIDEWTHSGQSNLLGNKIPDRLKCWVVVIADA